MELKKHLLNSTSVASISTAVCIGFIAFSRRTAEINTSFEPLLYSRVGVSVLISAYVAYSIFCLFKEYTNRPYELFMYLSGAILIISYMPIGHLATNMEGAGIAEINVLGTIHVLAAVFIISGIAKLEMMDRI